MISVKENAYINTVIRSATADQNQHQISDWLGRQDEAGAVPILKGLKSAIKSEKRYRFQEATKRDEAIKRIFEKAFKQAPEQIIQSAEELAGRAFYSPTRKVCWIQIPNRIQSVLGNRGVQIILGIATAVMGYHLGFKIYGITSTFFASRAIPFLINNAPLQIIRLFNLVMSGKDWIYKNSLKFIGAVWITREMIVQFPEIPYLTAAARMINIWTIIGTIFSAPQTIGGFLFTTSVDLCTFIWNNFDKTAQFFGDLAQRSERGRISISKQEAYQLWAETTSRMRPALIGGPIEVKEGYFMA